MCILLLVVMHAVVCRADMLHQTWTTRYTHASSPSLSLVGGMGDGNGAVYVLANGMQTNGLPFVTLAKIDLEGDVSWETHLHPDADMTGFSAKAMDGRENLVAVCVEVQLANGFTNALTALVSGEGTLLWSRRQEPTNMVHVAPRAVHVLESGRVALGGSVGIHAFVCVYDDEGTVLWHRESSFTPPPLSSDTTNVCIALGSDAHGNVHALNDVRFWLGISWARHMFVSYDPSGAERWHVYPSFTAFAADPGGSVYGVQGGSTGTVMKYNGDGILVWTNTFGAGINHFQQSNVPRNVHIAPDGDGIVLAYQYYNGKLWRYSAARFLSGGERAWDFINNAREINGSHQQVNHSTITPDGHLFLAGSGSLFVVSPSGQKAFSATPSRRRVAGLGALDVVTMRHVSGGTGTEIELARVSRFPPFTPDLFAVYDVGMGDAEDPALRFTVPARKGLPISVEWCTNLVDGPWTPLPHLWHGTSVVTTITMTNPLPNAYYRIRAMPDDE